MNRRIFLFIFVLMVTSLGFLPVVSAQGITGTVTRNVNLRAGPGTEWRRITVVRPGVLVTFDGRNGASNWARGVTQDGQVGWLTINYLTVPADQIATLPAISADAPITVNAPNANTAVASSAPAAAPAEAPAAAASGTVATGTAVSSLNVRSGPGTSFGRIGRLNAGEAFNVDGRDGSGAWVRGVGARGASGWVSANYLRGVSVAGLPVVSGNAVTASAPAGSAPANTAPAAPVVSNAAPVRGFDYGGHTHGLTDATVNAMRRAGMSWVKTQFRYQQGQDPNVAAGMINDAHAKGFRILLGVVGSRDELNNGNYFNDYANFVAGLAGLGADAIEIWNEPNIDREWPAGQIDPGRYTQLLAASYNAIKGRNGNTLVISGAPAPTGFFGGCAAAGCDDAPYIAGMAAAGAANYADCIGAHYNEGIVGPSQRSGDPRDGYYTRYFFGMLDTYYNAFGGRRPICFTELGYLSSEGYGPLPGGFAWAANVSVAQQAAWLDEAVSLAANSGRVRLLIVWNVDFTEYGSDPMGGYAMIRPGGGCPACDALSQ